jgi:hypothetical protein
MNITKPTYINGPLGPRFLGPASFPLRQSLNNGLTNAIMGMPQKFRDDDGTNNFSQGRKIFINAPVCSSIINGPNQSSIRVDSNTPNCSQNIPNYNWSRSSVHSVHGRHNTGTIQNGKKSEVTSSDLYIQRKKNKAIGSGSTNKSGTDFSFKSNNKTNINTNNQALTRVRAGGSVAPAKKGAVANTYRSGGHGSIYAATSYY